MKVSDNLKFLLDEEVRRHNSPQFIASDPVQFPRRFLDKRDIEISGLIAATLAWGNRTMICNNIEKMLARMDYEPYNYVKDQEYERLDPEMNIHRTVFGRDMQYLLRGLREIYVKHGSLDALAYDKRVNDSETPSWELVREMHRYMLDRNEGEYNSRILPANLDQTALKRINMALRWFVRDDGIVDLGIWESISKSKLYIPLDVHVGNTARLLGMLERKSNDRKAVLELTDTLRQLNPEDPVIYDYALFGIGVSQRKTNN